MDNLSAVESIFLAALDKPSAAERAAYLDDACGQDADLRRRVERLLSAHPKAGSFLKSPAPDLTAAFSEQPIAERPGTTIGPYKLMEQLGEGGMGLVFVAEQQQPVRRRVALKVVKPGMDSREIIARFEAERQALALMDHPHIAKVLDAGTTDTGRPYFVMELVMGVPITDYCNQQQLTPRQRLELFVPICNAVQHAHLKGIIHRDLKPSNVLVSSHDGTPVVKVIDFGIAKAIGQQLSDKTIYTRVAQMIGTPLYMSPEQAGMSDLDVDTRSDVYSLGVLLYELLTGTTPFDPKRLQQAAFDEIRRIIREEEPPKPSTRLSALGDTLSSISAKRKTEPRKLPGLVRGDLDWIVMKALDKDRTRRYETASAFAADVRRFLTEEPVEARPPSALYRFRKFARRHRTAVFIASFVALTVLAILLNETVGYFQIKAARDDAEADAVRATKAEGVAKEQEKAAVAAAAREEAQRKRAEDAKETLRHALYDVEMSLVPPTWEADNLARFDQLLSRQRPAPGESDLRTFEWHYWDHLRRFGLPGVKLVAEARLGATLASKPVLSPDGTRVAAVVVENDRGVIRVWDTTTGKVVRTLLDGLDYRKPLLAGPVGIVFSANSPRVAVSMLVMKNVDKFKLLYGIATDDELKDTRLHVRVWDIAGGRPLINATVATFPSPYSGLALSPDGKRLVFSAQLPAGQTQSTQIHLWDVDRNKELSSHADAATPTALAFSPDGARLAGAMASVRRSGGLSGIGSFDWGHKIQIWEVNPWKDVLTIKHPTNLAPIGVAFSPARKKRRHEALLERHWQPSPEAA